jgi:hypothetical protein
MDSLVTDTGYVPLRHFWQFKIILNDPCLQLTMAEKKGFLERIFGRQDSCCCGPKIVPKTGVKKDPDATGEPCCCCGPKIVPKPEDKKEQ